MLTGLHARDLAYGILGVRRQQERLEDEQWQLANCPGPERGLETISTSIDHQLDVNAQGNIWWQRFCPECLPLSDKDTSLFLSRVADKAVMGLVTLATFTATYLLAWGKHGSKCIPKINFTKGSNGKDFPSWQQILISLLPFAIFPLALFVSGLAKIAEIDKRALSYVSTFCLCEFILAILLGAGMTCCMAGAPLYLVLFVTVIPTIVIVMTWKLTFKYPKGPYSLPDVSKHSCSEK